MTAREDVPVQIDPMLFPFALSARCHLAILRNVSTADDVSHSIESSMLDLYPLLRPQPHRYITFDLDLERALGLPINFCQGHFYY